MPKHQINHRGQKSSAQPPTGSALPSSSNGQQPTTVETSADNITSVPGKPPNSKTMLLSAGYSRSILQAIRSSEPGAEGSSALDDHQVWAYRRKNEAHPLKRAMTLAPISPGDEEKYLESEQIGLELTAKIHGIESSSSTIPELLCPNSDRATPRRCPLSLFTHGHVPPTPPLSGSLSTASSSRAESASPGRRHANTTTASGGGGAGSSGNSSFFRRMFRTGSNTSTVSGPATTATVMMMTPKGDRLDASSVGNIATTGGTGIRRGPRPRKSISCERLPVIRDDFYGAACTPPSKTTTSKATSIDVEKSATAEARDDQDQQPRGDDPPPVVVVVVADGGGGTTASINCCSTNAEDGIATNMANTTLASANNPSSNSTNVGNAGKNVVTISFAVCARALAACADGRLPELESLLEQYPALLNYAHPYSASRLTCLHVAAQAGSALIVRQLVSRGADLNARDDNWSTPLHLAARADQRETVHLLAYFGADTSLRDGHGLLYTGYLSVQSQAWLNAQRPLKQPLAHLSSVVNDRWCGGGSGTSDVGSIASSIFSAISSSSSASSSSFGRSAVRSTGSNRAPLMYGFGTAIQQQSLLAGHHRRHNTTVSQSTTATNTGTLLRRHAEGISQSVRDLLKI